jgi:putative transposase
MSYPCGMLGSMARHTTFRYRLDPTGEQAAALARHAGASRFAYNQCLRLHRQARRDQQRDAAVVVPWTGFDFINTFNAWKKTSDAGRVVVVDSTGQVEVVTTGLAWRGEVCQQVFEEAAVDLGNALRAWSDSRRGKRSGRRAGYPRTKKKGRAVPSFRLRNKHPKNRRPAIRIGEGHPRSVTLPGIGTIRVFDNTRPLRRLLAKARGKVLFATASLRGGRWWISLNVEAAELHPAARHAATTAGRWVGVDRGLSAFAVSARADGREMGRVDAEKVPKPLSSGMNKLRRLARDVTRKPRGSNNRRKAAARLGRYHYRVACIRKNFLHQVSNELVKTHDRLAIEDLNVAGMLRNRRLARSITDAGWAEFARLLGYKQAWHGGQLVLADRWFPSSKTCSDCGHIRTDLGMGERTYHCTECGASLDRDLNAAINLAAWAEQHHALAGDRQAGGPVTNAHRQDGTGLRSRASETSLEDVGTRRPTATAA